MRLDIVLMNAGMSAKLLCLPDGAHRVHGEARQRRARAAGEHGDAIVVARVRIGIHAGEDSAPLVVRGSSKRQKANVERQTISENDHAAWDTG